MQQGKKYEPTDENKKLVKTLAAVGITFEDIATKLEISSDTLVEYVLAIVIFGGIGVLLAWRG